MEYKNKRVAGIVTLLLGAVFGKFFIFDVLRAAREGAAQITIYRSGIGISLACILLGMLYLILGERAERLIKFDKDNLKFLDVVILLTIAGAGLAGYVWVDMELSALGYK
jgi:hypothetical protein